MNVKCYFLLELIVCVFSLQVMTRQTGHWGDQGGLAIVETLFGMNNPNGKLPVTFYKNLSQLPDYEDYDMSDRTYRYFRGEPLYPFGYGLSYYCAGRIHPYVWWKFG